jgi:hypothetical protein
MPAFDPAFLHIHHIPGKGRTIFRYAPFFLSRFSSRGVGHDELEFRPALVIVIHEDFEAAAQVWMVRQVNWRGRPSSSVKVI